ncbi:hypothetical protein EIP86_008023 [Pleurotus ostreatoroseus]|nr:hypothetical protein EIP86_008023 [Pleurotus ostreatoroseus]
MDVFKEKVKEAQTLALLRATTIKELPPLIHHWDDTDELTILNSGANIVLEELGVRLPLQQVITTAQFYDEIAFEFFTIYSNHVLDEPPPHRDDIAKIAKRLGIDLDKDPPMCRYCDFPIGHTLV